MRELLPLLVGGLVPFAVLVLIVGGSLLSLVAWQPPILQTIQFGTADSQNSISALASDSTGIYATGFVGDNNVTPTYMFVNKYGLDEHQVWTQHFGDPYLSDVPGIAVGADGVYVAGYISFSPTNYSSFVTKYDLNGNQVWSSRFFQNSSSSVMSASSSLTSVYVAGYNGTQYFVKDFDVNGNLAWTRFFGTNPDRISVLAGSNAVYLAYDNATGTGLVQGYDSAGNLRWTMQPCTCRPLGITSDGTGLYVVGTVQRASLVPSDGFLTKYDTNGNQLWTTRFTPPAGNFASPGVDQVRASADSSGVYLTETTGDQRGFVMKYGSAGDHDWSLQLPWTAGTGTRSPFDVITAEQESLYVGGEIGGLASLAGTAFIASISKSSSLVFFGINPPFSFGLLGLLVAGAVASVAWFTKRWKRRTQYSGASMNRRLKNIPADFFWS